MLGIIINDWKFSLLASLLCPSLQTQISLFFAPHHVGDCRECECVCARESSKSGPQSCEFN